MAEPYNSPIRNAQRAATKARIEKAAKDVFDAKGWERSTIRLIAKRAGVSTGAIFGIWDAGKKSLWSEVTQIAPPVDGALWRSAPGMLTVLQAIQSAEDVNRAHGVQSLSNETRAAIDAIVASATTRLPFEAF